MRKRRPGTALIMVGAAGFLLGLFGTALWSAERVWTGGSVVPGLEEVARLEAVRVLPRTELLVLALEADALLDDGRPWAAWRLLAGAMEDPEVAPAPAVLTAARAAGEWGGWAKVRALLSERAWLDRAERGEGWYLLARAHEELGDEPAAVAAYRRYVELGAERSRGIALGRMGRLLRASGDPAGSAAAFAAARQELPQIGDWLYALELEQLGRAGDESLASLAGRGTAGSAPVRLRRVRAEVVGMRAAGDEEGALSRLAWEAEVLSRQGARAEAGRLQLDRARLLAETGRPAEGRELLRSIAWEGSVPAEVRVRAAELLGELPDVTPAEQMGRAAAYEAADKPGLAARALRSAIAAGVADDGGLRLKLARLLYAERDYGPARIAFLEAAERLQEPELVAEARLHAARALYRASSRERTKAVAEIRQVAESHPRTAAGGTAFFLLGDEASTLQSALALYRRAAEVGHSEDAREALFRVGDRALKLKDPAGALRAWTTYVERYPRGEATARVAYEAGKLHERAGRDAQAREMYAAAMRADPVSYYAIRAGDRLGTDPLQRILAASQPWTSQASDEIQARNVLRRLDALQALGLSAEWQEELDAATRALSERPAALASLAEGLRDRHYPVQAIRIGRGLVAERGGEWDERLLRIVFPFPYRELIEAESRRFGVDPLLLAALIRQESTFRPAVRSWVGATGLGQIMPATGRWLAPMVGITAYEEKLLEVPEVNLRMSAKYLRDLVRRYDGARDLALAGYNAGPGRADRWRRQFDHGRDIDAFREAIPFDETRHYVKVVLRNYAVYQQLYGDSPAPGLLRQAD